MYCLVLVAAHFFLNLSIPFNQPSGIAHALRGVPLFNAMWGTIIGLMVGVAGKLLMPKEDGGSWLLMIGIGIGGSLVPGCLMGFLDNSSGIVSSYFGAVFVVVVYPLVKTSFEFRS